MATKTKTKSSSKNKSCAVRVHEPIHAKVVAFADQYRLSIVDAYSVMVNAFARLSSDEQVEQIKIQS